jgi:isopentenyl phosphate kinase
MRERVVLKWGGGLITEKSRLKTVRTDVLDSLAEQLSEVLAEGVDVVLVHGAGSFGHLKAKQYRLAEGRLDDALFDGEHTQLEAVGEVRNDMVELNDHVMKALTTYDISAVSLAPHTWATNTGPEFGGDVAVFGAAPQGIVMVTHGDVVDCTDERAFGILSGDDLVVRLATEVQGVTRVVFAMGGVEGVLAQPPKDGEEQMLLPTLGRNEAFSGEHASDLDVTGGIGLKVDRGFMVLESGIEVLLVSGEHEGRVRGACLGREVRGTRLVP